MEIDDLNRIVKDIVDGGKQCYKLTPRELFSAFGFSKRTKGNCRCVDKYLLKRGLEVSPHYKEVWVDKKICLQKKQEKENPEEKIYQEVEDLNLMKSVESLEAANNMPLYVDKSQTIAEAITLMLVNGYSQMPVQDGEELCGYVSSKHLMTALNSTSVDEKVENVMRTRIPKVDIKDYILKAVDVIRKNDFVVVMNGDNVCGIITTDDLSRQYSDFAQQYVTLAEIECYMRRLIQKVCNQAEINEACGGKSGATIMDTGFNAYIKLLRKEETWNKLGYKYLSQKIFIEALTDVKNIRNSFMHYKAIALNDDDKETLIQFVKFLRMLLGEE